MALVVVVLLVLGAAAFIVLTVIDQRSADAAVRDGGSPWPLYVIALGVWAWKRARIADVMWRAEGCYVFVEDHQVVPHTRTLLGHWPVLGQAHWLRLTHVVSGTDLGWVCLSARAARTIDSLGACALFGDPSRRSRSVLAGPFKPALPRGRSHAALPGPFWWIKGRARRGRWLIETGAPPPRGPHDPGQ